MKQAVLEVNLPAKLFARGKVRDNFTIPNTGKDGGEGLLMVTTDRISAFDVVMFQGVPELGKIRNQISLFWFGYLEDICPNHILSSDQSICVGRFKKSDIAKNDLMGRCVLVSPVDVIPVECVVRGYLTGSAWEAYQKDEPICGVELPRGYKESEMLPFPIFTPTTKAKIGHDEPITFWDLVGLLGKKDAYKLRDKSLTLYGAAVKYARRNGIIIADTKFEFGIDGKGKIILIDEALTPDSSRFWDNNIYKPGGSQPSFDKQPLRDWLETSGWNKESPPPELPDEVIEGIKNRYKKAYEFLTGKYW